VEAEALLEAKEKASKKKSSKDRQEVYEAKRKAKFMRLIDSVAKRAIEQCDAAADAAKLRLKSATAAIDKVCVLTIVYMLIWSTA
jgi:hypothetical protein